MTIRSEDMRRAADPHAAVIAATPQLPTRSGETAATAMAAKAQALIQSAYEVAFHRPRDFDQVREKLLKDCRRPSFAQVAEYAKPIGGDKVRGPSIRMAEAAIRCMTNIVVDTTTVYDDPEKRIVNVRILDLESNVPYAQDVTIEKSVERKSKKDGDVVLRERLNSYGHKLYIIVATDDEILNKQNALISKALRTQALRLVPGDLIDEALSVARQTRGQEDAKDPDAAKRAIYDAFAQVGVRVEQIKEYLGHDGTTLTPAELDTLRSLYAALRDSETTWREIMDSREPPKPKDPKEPSTKSQARPVDQQRPAETEKAAETSSNKRPAPAIAERREKAEELMRQAEQLSAEQTSAIGKTIADEFAGAGEGRITFNEITLAIASAKTPDDIDKNIIPMIPEIPNENHRKTLTNLANSKKKALQEQGGEEQPQQQQQQQQPRTQARSASVPTQTSRRTQRNLDMD